MIILLLSLCIIALWFVTIKTELPEPVIVEKVGKSLLRIPTVSYQLQSPTNKS